MGSATARMIGIGLGLGLALTLVCGCVQIGDGVTDDGIGDGFVGEDEVMVVFRNFTRDQAVDVEFHATDDSLAALPDDLFVDGFLITGGIGLAGTGILAPRAVDFVELACTENTTLGTAGGAFLDNSTGDETGRGTARWMEAAPLGLCGGVVTFTFDEDDGEFSTVVSISR